MDQKLTNTDMSTFVNRCSVERDFGRHRLSMNTGSFCSFDKLLSNGTHHHNYFEICWVLSGQGEFHHGDEIFQLLPNDVFVADPSITHEINSFKTKDLRLVFLNFSILHNSKVPLSNDPFDAVLEGFVSEHRLVAHRQDHLQHYLQLIQSQHWGLESSSAFLEQILLIFCLELIACLVPSGTKSKMPRHEPRPLPLQLALDHLHKNISNNPQPKDLALAAGVCERQLRRLFSLHLKTTVVDEINRQRMNAAVHQVLMRFPVQNIGFNLGFEHPGEFSRMFKKYIGVSPKKYQASFAPNEVYAVTTHKASW